MNINPKYLNTLKKKLEKGDISEALLAINSISSANDLKIIREQKLLLKVRTLPQQMQLATAYKATVERALSDQVSVIRAKMYADFTIVAVNLFKKLNVEINKYRKTIQVLSSIEFIKLLEDVLKEYFENFLEQYWETTNLKLGPGTDEIYAPERADLIEYLLHQSTGTSNNIAFAGARVLNEFIDFTKLNKNKLKSGKIRFNKNKLKELIILAHTWNLLEYTVDKVTYGEWFVSEIKNKNSVEVTFGISDLSLDHARTIGLRRQIVQRYFSQEKMKPIRRVLEKFTISTLNYGINFYMNNFSSSPLLPEEKDAEYESLQKRLLCMLDLLSVDDEILLVASKEDSNTLIYYLCAIALRCFLEAARFVGEFTSSQNKKAAFYLPIPTELVVSIVEDAVESYSLASIILESQLLKLPISRYLEILCNPFIKLSQRQVIGLQFLNVANWSHSVRLAIVKGGALARSYGDIWEQNIADALDKYGWTILGRGIKVRRNKKILTDVDILAVKQDLLLVIQVKAILGEGVSTYEQWKAKEIIIKGTEQALIAETELSSDSVLLKSILSSKRLKKSVTKVQPIVVTNYPLFTGWSYNNIPVISFGYLMSLLRGAKVEYKRPDGSVAAVRRFAESSELTTEEFIQLIRQPLDWQIAKENSEVEYNLVELKHIKLALPTLQRNAELRL